MADICSPLLRAESNDCHGLLIEWLMLLDTSSTPERLIHGTGVARQGGHLRVRLQGKLF